MLVYVRRKLCLCVCLYVCVCVCVHVLHFRDLEIIGFKNEAGAGKRDKKKRLFNNEGDNRKPSIILKQNTISVLFKLF